jgi:hypothetical protein
MKTITMPILLPLKEEVIALSYVTQLCLGQQQAVLNCKYQNPLVHYNHNMHLGKLTAKNNEQLVFDQLFILILGSIYTYNHTMGAVKQLRVVLASEADKFNCRLSLCPSVLFVSVFYKGCLFKLYTQKTQQEVTRRWQNGN